MSVYKASTREEKRREEKRKAFKPRHASLTTAPDKRINALYEAPRTD